MDAFNQEDILVDPLEMTVTTKDGKQDTHFLSENIARTLNGDMTKINPYRTLNEQVNLIPYDSKFEIKYSDFTVTQVVGSGNFGTVFEGKASLSCNPTKEVKVAIKTL